MGRLTVAYNAAVEQVAAAFEERARVEAEMRSLLGDAGHALRTPLTVVSGFIDALDRGAVDDSSMRDRAFRALRVESARMRALVEGLMSLARLEQIENREARALSVGEAARTAIGIVREARGGDITLRLAGEDTAFADPAEVHEAIVNLVENAVKYGARTPVLVSICREGNYVLVRVQDQGPGIPEADRTLLFQRFFRGSNSTHIEGSGLGLAIAKRAIQRCGGSIELENGGSGKTAFILRLPAA
jgi:signal transduction histidine kinase